MITVLSCTNRADSNTLKVARQYVQLVEKQGVKCSLLSFEKLPANIASTEFFGPKPENFNNC
ncbi:MAG: hypothetical protein K0Q95_1069 [Bacteroidota bacterium]|jgi:hypothetical protein|nr:hypothetical protein [Bacteroidota bacterium]